MGDLFNDSFKSAYVGYLKVNNFNDEFEKVFTITQFMGDHLPKSKGWIIRFAHLDEGLGEQKYPDLNFNQMVFD